MLTAHPEFEPIVVTNRTTFADMLRDGIDRAHVAGVLVTDDAFGGTLTALLHEPRGTRGYDEFHITARPDGNDDFDLERSQIQIVPQIGNTALERAFNFARNTRTYPHVISQETVIRPATFSDNRIDRGDIGRWLTTYDLSKPGKNILLHTHVPLKAGALGRYQRHLAKAFPVPLTAENDQGLRAQEWYAAEQARRHP